MCSITRLHIFYRNRYNAFFVMQRETQGMDNTEKLQYVLLRLKNIYKITRFKRFEKRMVVRISDKTQNYSKVTKLLVKPFYFRINTSFQKIKAKL